MKKYEDYVLCYAEGNKAYFTKKKLDEQWGDDWGISPYEHNAGEPYSNENDDIYTLYVEACKDSSGLISPYNNSPNSPYSVKSINSGVIPWLSFNKYYPNGSIRTCHLYAGVTLKEFVKKVRSFEGKIFTQLEED